MHIFAIVDHCNGDPRCSPISRDCDEPNALGQVTTRRDAATASQRTSAPGSGRRPKSLNLDSQSVPQMDRIREDNCGVMPGLTVCRGATQSLPCGGDMSGAMRLRSKQAVAKTAAAAGARSAVVCSPRGPPHYELTRKPTTRLNPVDKTKLSRRYMTMVCSRDNSLPFQSTRNRSKETPAHSGVVSTTTSTFENVPYDRVLELAPGSNRLDRSSP